MLYLAYTKNSNFCFTASYRSLFSGLSTTLSIFSLHACFYLVQLIKGLYLKEYQRQNLFIVIVQLYIFLIVFKAGSTIICKIFEIFFPASTTELKKKFIIN